MADDWDLNAIVRSCSSASATSAAEPEAASCSDCNKNNPLAGLTFDDEPDPFSFPDLAVQSYSFPDLKDSYKPFLSAAVAGQRSTGFISPSRNPTTATTTSSSSDFGALTHLRTTVTAVSPRVVDHKTHHQQQRQPQDLGGRHRNQRLQSTIISLGPPPSSVVVHPALRTAATMQSQPAAAARSRKKKNNQKRLVVHVTADNLSNDVWAWRKYGQKPIKGSPYPRNYYRCSSSKGCAARKQVERSTTDPNMFIISYAGDHSHPKPTHRNSLAGSTRTKFPAAKSEAEVNESDAAVEAGTQPPPPPQPQTTEEKASAVSLSPTTPLSATMDHDHNNNNNNNNNVGAGLAAAEMMATRKTASSADMDDDVDGSPEFESGEDDANMVDFDGICDDDDTVLIPNNNNVVGGLDEDLFITSWQELGGVGTAVDGAAFGDNFSPWIYGSTSAACGGGGGGG